MTAPMDETPTYCCVMLDLAFDPESIPSNPSRSQRRQAHVIWATGAAHRAFDVAGCCEAATEAVGMSRQWSPGDVAMVTAGKSEYVAIRTSYRNGEYLPEFADPKPPKPDEPMGFAAVVEDVDGALWISHRQEAEWVQPWHKGESDFWANWSDVAAVKVLSEGVTP